MDVVARAVEEGGTMEASTRRRTGAAALLVAAALMGCGDDGGGDAGPAREVPEAERRGGTVVLAGTAGVGTFNPAVTNEDLDYQLQRNVLLMTLLRADAELEPRPYLAESWEINEDSTGVVFHLRDDVRWHDGEPTTAGDVAFTFGLLKSPEAQFSNAGWFEGWEGAEVVDTRTIRFAVRPRAGLLAGWTRLPILPRHLMSDTDPADIATHPFGTTPTGNGPFRFVERRGGDTWVFEANDEFPEALGGRPYIDRLVYREIADPATQLAELRSGGVHLVQRLLPGQVTRVRALPGVEVVEYPSRAYGFIGWNGQRPVFQDAAVRRALTMGIDRAGMVDAVRGGLGEVANGPIGPWHPAYDAGMRPLPYAPDSARALLGRAGWVDADADGVRERDGAPFRFRLITSDNATYRDIAEIVQADLLDIGVSVTVSSMDGTSFLDAVLSPERRFDAFVLEWNPDFEVDDRQLFSCAAIGEAFQFASYCNRDLEPVLDSIPAARSREDANRLIREYARIVERDQPFTFLYFARDAAGVRRELRDVAPDIRGDLVNVTRWWLHPDARAADASAAAR